MCIHWILFIIAAIWGFPAAHALTFATRNQLAREEKPSHNFEPELVLVLVLVVCSELMTTSEWTHQIRNSSYFPPTAEEKRVGVLPSPSPGPSSGFYPIIPSSRRGAHSKSMRMMNCLLLLLPLLLLVPLTSWHKWFKTKSDSRCPDLGQRLQLLLQLQLLPKLAGVIFYDARRPQEPSVYM